MINNVVLVGRLVKDPDLRYSGNGVAVANFTIACNRPFSNQQGERETDFVSCVTWRKQAENLANYMSKGSQIGVEGRIQTRNYENNEGQRVFVTEVVADNIQFLESKNEQRQPQTNVSTNSNVNTPQDNKNAQNGSNPFSDKGAPTDISDDDLPF